MLLAATRRWKPSQSWRSEIGGQFTEFRDVVLLKLVLNIALGILLTILGQTGVQFYTTIGRCIRSDVYLLDFATIVLISLGNLDGGCSSRLCATDRHVYWPD